jgi:oligosaccharide repeat unit polymerase
MQTLSNTFAVAVGAFVALSLVVHVRKNLYFLLTGRSVVLITVVYWYLFEAVRLPSALQTYTQEEYNFGVFCILISVAAFLGAYHASNIALFAPLARRLKLLNNPRFLWSLTLAAMAIGLGSMLIYLNFNVFAFFEGLTGMTRRWTGSNVRGRYGSWSTILFELQVFLWAAVPLCFSLLAVPRVPVPQKILAATFIVWMFLRTLFAGTRSPLMVFFVLAGATILWKATPRLRQVLLVVGVPVVLVGGYFLSAIIVAGRNEGHFDTNAALDTEYVGVEMFRELLFVVRAHDNGMPPQYGLTYLTQLVNPIPRAIWPGKPVADAGLIMAAAYGAVDRNGEPVMTVSPGFLGEAYLNFGFLGLLVVPVVAGVLVRSWDRLVPVASSSFPALLVYAAGLPTIMASARSFNFSNYYPLCALFALLFVCHRLYRPNPVDPRRLPVRGRAAKTALNARML